MKIDKEEFLIKTWVFKCPDQLKLNLTGLGLGIRGSVLP